MGRGGGVIAQKDGRKGGASWEETRRKKKQSLEKGSSLERTQRVWEEGMAQRK